MGQIDFLTEKETEALLERETRNLPMPNGSFRAITDFKLFWEVYDRLLFISDYTPAWFVEMALEEVELSGRSLVKSFQKERMFHRFSRNWLN